jgi:replicative DNA helicase
MPRRAIFTKILSRLARVSYTDLLLKGRPYLDSGYSVSEDRAQYLSVKPEELTAAMARLQAIAGRFYVIDKTDGPLDTERLEAQIAWAQAEHDGKRALVVIDHLQIFPTGAQAFSGIKDKIDYLVAAFEGVKDRTGAAVLVISQKNRAGYYGKGLETLMGSAQIEYTADAVLLLDSKQEQEARERRKSGTEKSELDELMAYAEPEEAIELIIAKQRYNTPGRLPLVFAGRYSEFSESSK